MSELGEVLRQLPLPDSGPRRERAVMAARAASTRTATSRAWLPRGRRMRLALATVAAVAVLATPPGQAAVKWAADVVGVGEVGGPPTEPSKVGDFTPASGQIVLASGTTADGVPFEIVAFRSDMQIANHAEPSVCVNAEFPGSGGDGSGGCYSGALRYGAVCCSYTVLHDKYSSVPRVEGQVSPEVSQVEVTYVDTEGNPRQVDATVGMITPRFAEKLKIDHPSGLFLASLPDLAVQTGIEPLEGYPAQPVKVSTYDEDGTLLESESIQPASGKRIQQMQDVDRAREARERFDDECLPELGKGPGEPVTIDADELSAHCRELLDAMSP